MRHLPQRLLGERRPQRFFMTVSGRLSLMLAIIFAFHSPTRADDGSRRWSLSGFGSLSASGADSDGLGFRRDRTQAEGVTRAWDVTPDSRLGVQLDADLADSLHGVVQWVARNHAGDFFEQNLEWAFLRWRPQSDLNLRIGRLGYDAFMLSDYRNVGYAYPWMRPPHEFYANLPVTHFDGMDLSKKLALGEGYLTIKGFAGYSNLEVPALFSRTLTFGAVLSGGNLVYEWGDWTARASYSYAHNQSELPKALFAALENPGLNQVWPQAAGLSRKVSIKDGGAHFGAVGLAYDDGVWLAQMEASYTGANVDAFPDVGSGYLSLGRRMGGVTLYALTGVAKSFHRRIPISRPLFQVHQAEELRAQIDGLLNNNGVDQKSISLGARWDVYKNVALKAQWSHFWLGHNGAQFWTRSKPYDGARTEIEVWSLGVDFLF
jgi:hypothetical protein